MLEFVRFATFTQSLAFAAMLVCIAASPAPAVAEISDGVVKIGVLNDQTGVYADLGGPGSVEAAARDADVVINLVGILFERGRQSFETVQALGAEAVARAASAVGARMVHISALGADEASPSQYARSKAMGEKLVFAAAPDAIVLRPSVVFGPEDDFFNKFASIARFRMPATRSSSATAGASSRSPRSAMRRTMPSSSGRSRRTSRGTII